MPVNQHGKARGKPKSQRQERRAFAGIAGTLGTPEGRRPFARAPGKTGSANHWLARVQAARAAEEALRKILTRDLLEACPAITNALALDFPNVWLLSQATYPALSGVKGIGPAKLRIIRDYLEVNDVPVAWGVPI